MHDLAGLLPCLTLLAAAALLWPAKDAIAPLRLAFLRAAVVTGAGAVVLVEVLSAVQRVTSGFLWTAWALAAAGTALAAALRLRRHRVAVAALWRRVSGAVRAGRWALLPAVPLAVLLAGELVVAFAAPPNTYDSLAYHLPRIEHWAQDASVAPYATAIYRQQALAPGAEYLLLHLRLLTGGDHLHNLLQWAAGLGCVLAASRIAAQLGASAVGQVLAGVVFATAPMVVLQATSTQTDLTAATWAMCLVTFALDGLRSRTRPQAVLLIGAAFGLALLTKAPTAVVVAPVLVWWGVAQLRLARPRLGRRPDLRLARTVARPVAAVMLVIACGVAIAGPFYASNLREWGSPAGPPWLRASTSMQRHDPAAIAMNAARIGATALVSPSDRANGMLVAGVRRLGRITGVDPSDPAITFPGKAPGWPFSVSWYVGEDFAAFPAQALLLLVGTAACLAGRRRTALVRGYAAVVVIAGIAFIAAFSWQPWINRLDVPMIAMAAPAAGVWLEGLLNLASGWRRALATVLVTALITTAWGFGGYALAYGFPRPLLGSSSVLTTDRETVLWAHGGARTAWRTAAATARASDPATVGLVQTNNSREYLWWRYLRPDGKGPEIVSLTSTLPRTRAPSADSVDAILCTRGPTDCATYIPDGWDAQRLTGVTVATPPEGSTRKPR